MALFNNWPWTKYSDVNLAWLLNEMKKLNISFDDLVKYINNEIETENEYLKEEIAKLNDYLITNLETTLEELIAEGHFSVDLAYDYDEIEEALTFKLVAQEVNNG